MKHLLVVFYHRILPFKGYDVDVETFEWHLSFFNKHFKIVGADILDDIKNGKNLSKPSVLITFDDGFADNYVYAYPLLKKYKAKALIFIPTSKITNRKPRKTLYDYWHEKAEFSELFMPGKEAEALKNSLEGIYDEFLSWEELEEMKSDGVFDIGSHGHLHAKLFSSDNIIDIYQNNNVHWSFYYASNYEFKEGIPVFEMKSSLATKRFIPSKKIKQDSINLYKNSKNPEEIIKKLNKYIKKGETENEEDYKSRIYKELKTSKDLIKKNLNVNTKFLSWPWGEFSKEGIQIAKAIGFEFCFTTKKTAFFGKNFCEIGRIKAPITKTSFLRKMLVNSNTFLARAYERMHS